MLNPYSIILGFFVASGVLVTLWGVRIIVIARKTLKWPFVGGKIEESRINFGAGDLLPYIVFSYNIGEKNYQQQMTFPRDITPSQEFTKSYLEKYPAGFLVQVFYDPNNPETATLEPGPAEGDWLILVVGLAMLVLGLLMFFVVL